LFVLTDLVTFLLFCFYSQTFHIQSETDAFAQGGFWDPEGDWTGSFWRGIYYSCFLWNSLFL